MKYVAMPSLSTMPLSIVIDFLMVSLIKLVIYDVKVQSNYNFVLLRVHL